MTNLRKPKFLLLLGIIGIVFVSIALAGIWQYLDSRAISVNKTPKTVDISRGMGSKQIAQLLAKQGIIEMPQYFSVQARFNDYSQRLQAGEYQIFPNTGYKDILEQIAQGEVIEYRFRIPEGSTVMQVLALLSQRDEIKQTLTSKTPQDVLRELGLQLPFLEGFLFPDTYVFTRNTTDREILIRAVKAMQNLLQDMWEDRIVPTKPDIFRFADPYQVLILASIIEKESGLDEDRVVISQVFHNRLSQGMRLQTDPTIIYGLGESFDGNLTRRHLRMDTAYNTYTRHGLPPTPIAQPSRRSLYAAFHPSNGPYLYFVARGDGSSEFSTTLAQHNAAVRKYQLGIHE